jgi:predicted esterase
MTLKSATEFMQNSFVFSGKNSIAMAERSQASVSIHTLDGQSRLWNCDVVAAPAAAATTAKRTLIVWVHAYQWNDQRQQTMQAFLERKFPGADLLMPRYRGGLANENAFWLAAELQRLIAEVFENSASEARGQYENIVLIGYSAGALLLRKALVYGLGQLQDHPFPELGRQVAKTWSKIRPLCRIVLLAGVNRGWSFETRPTEVSPFQYAAARVALALARITPLIGRFILSLERGAPFVANLRVQWIRLSQELDEDMPPVIQLLGGQDGIVRKEDNKDILVSKDFIFIPVAYSNHRTIVDFDDPQDGAARTNAFCNAIAQDIDELRRVHQESSSQLIADEIVDQRTTPPRKGARKTSATRPQLIFLVHGIRDNSDWPRELAGVIREQAGNKPVHCVTSSYGHFPMLHFLLLNMRKKNVRWFMDRYTEEVAKHPDAEVHFAGHSNGTYLLASGLRTYKAMTFDRVVFMGSVVPSNFPWRRYYDEGRVKAFRNDRASGDWVVGVFPAFFQLLGTVLPFQFFRDLGDGGFRGFDQSVGENHKENFYFAGGHGAATKAHNHPSLATFILTGEATADTELIGSNGYFQLLSHLCWLVWLLAATALIGAGIFIAGNFGAWAVTGYAVFVLLVLATI